MNDEQRNIWLYIVCCVAFLAGIFTGTLSFTQLLIFGGFLLLWDRLDARKEKGKL